MLLNFITEIVSAKNVLSVCILSCILSKSLGRVPKVGNLFHREWLKLH